MEESSEFSVNKLVLCAGCPLDLVPFLGETNVIDVMFLRSSLILSAPVAGTVADWPVHQKTGTLSSWIGTCSNLADRLIRAWIRVASHRPLTADTAIADKVGRVNRASLSCRFSLRHGHNVEPLNRIFSTRHGHKVEPLNRIFSSRHGRKGEPLNHIFSLRHGHEVEPLTWRFSSRHGHNVEPLNRIYLVRDMATRWRH